MIAPEEQVRRVLILSNALWEAREELSNRFHGIDRDGLDWFHREKLDESMEADRRVFRGRQELLLRAAYDGEVVVLKCMPEEREAAMDMAFRLLEGDLLPDCAVDQLWSDGFP